MIIVVIVISLILCIVAVCLCDVADVFEFGGVIFGLFFILSCLALLILVITNASMSVVEEKITMYEEENARIETQISEIVSEYQEYERGVISEINNESAITLIQLYPELTAQPLVQAQIDLYIENNANIRGLKEDLINRSVVRWWLYFGK